MKQLEHHNNTFCSKKFPIVLIAENISSPANLGSLFRLADAFHIEELVSCGNEIDLNSNRLKRVARSTEKNVPYRFVENIQSEVIHYQEKGYQLYCLEIAKNSIPIEKLELHTKEKLILVVGEERTGVSEVMLKQAKKSLHISMFGKNSSMNVAQATGIALYEITKKINALN